MQIFVKITIMHLATADTTAKIYKCLYSKCHFYSEISNDCTSQTKQNKKIEFRRRVHLFAHVFLGTELRHIVNALITIHCHYYELLTT